MTLWLLAFEGFLMYLRYGLNFNIWFLIAVTFLEIHYLAQSILTNNSKIQE